ncbi:unnamed protein product [Victoria cruziana]
MVGEVGRQHLEQERQRNGTGQRPQQAARAAEQGHDDHLEGDHRIEGNGGVDVSPARRHHRAGHRDESRAGDEEHELGTRDIDAHMPRNGFVLSDDTQGQPQARTLHPPAEGQHPAQQQQQLPVDLAVAHVEEDITPQGLGHVDFVPGDQLAHEFGQTKREDHEISARQAQGRQADQQGQQRTRNQRNRVDGEQGPGLAQHGHRIGADAIEGHAGQPWPSSRIARD